jgi:hypothetical protein
MAMRTTINRKLRHEIETIRWLLTLRLLSRLKNLEQLLAQHLSGINLA